MTDIGNLESIAAWFEMNHGYDRLKAGCIRDAIKDAKRLEAEVARLTRERDRALVTLGMLSSQRLADTPAEEAMTTEELIAVGRYQAGLDTPAFAAGLDAATMED